MLQWCSGEEAGHGHAHLGFGKSGRPETLGDGRTLPRLQRHRASPRSARRWLCCGGEYGIARNSQTVRRRATCLMSSESLARAEREAGLELAGRSGEIFGYFGFCRKPSFANRHQVFGPVRTKAAQKDSLESDGQ